MFDTDDVDEAKRMLPIYKRAVDLLETVIGKKTEQAEQEPVAYQEKMSGVLRYGKINDSDTPLYAAPVRTKDLTGDEIDAINFIGKTRLQYARAVIDADRRKNK